MPAKLSPEERERRRKERAKASFSDSAYKHYDATGGFGSEDEWQFILDEFQYVKELIHEIYGGTPQKTVNSSGSADIFSSAFSPQTFDDLKKAFRAAALEHHPDRGGNATKFVAAKEIYDRIKKRKRW